MQLKMYNPEIIPAIKCTLISFAGILLGVLPKPSGNVTWEGFIATLQPFSYLVTIIAGFMAIRHWYYATKKVNEKKITNPKHNIMPEEIKETEKEIEVDVPQMKKGTVQFMNKAGFNNPAPDKLKRVIAALKFSFVSIITMVSGTDLFTGYQSKIISFTLGLAIIILGGIELATGVKSIESNEK